MAARGHLTAMLAWATQHAAAHLGCADLAIFLRDTPSGDLILRAALRAGQPFAVNYDQRWSHGEGLIGAAARSGISQVVGDVTRDPRCQTVLARTRAELAVPLCYDGVVWGVFDVQSPRRDKFGAADVRFLEDLACQLATAQAATRPVLPTPAVSEEPSREHLLALLVTTTKIGASLMGCSLCAVYVLDEPGYSLALWDGFSLPARLLAHRLCVGEGLIERCAATASPVLISDVGVPPDDGTPRDHARSLLAVPLVGHQRQVLGVLCSGHAQPSYFTPRHRALLGAFAIRAAAAIEDARRHEDAWSARRG